MVVAKAILTLLGIGVVHVFSLLDDTPPPRKLMEALLSPEVYRA